MKQKVYRLDPKKMKKLAHSKVYCTASDRITVEGTRVGFMKRVSSDNTMDSGWRFYAGTEDGDYCDDGNNFGTFTLNDMANYDSDIIPLLSSPSGSEFRRDEKTGEFKPEE